MSTTSPFRLIIPFPGNPVLIVGNSPLASCSRGEYSFSYILHPPFHFSLHLSFIHILRCTRRLLATSKNWVDSYGVRFVKRLKLIFDKSSCFSLNLHDHLPLENVVHFEEACPWRQMGKNHRPIIPLTNPIQFQFSPHTKIVPSGQHHLLSVIGDTST